MRVTDPRAELRKGAALNRSLLAVAVSATLVGLAVTRDFNCTNEARSRNHSECVELYLERFRVCRTGADVQECDARVVRPALCADDCAFGSCAAREY